MRQLLLENLARNQSFDAALREGRSIDDITDAYVESLLFEPNAVRRAEQIKKLQTEIVREFDKKVQPAARQIGVDNARRVLAATPKAELPTPAFRARVLYEGKAQATDRVRIVQAMVNDRANTLENRLTAYYLEPGADAKQKLATLKHLHRADAKARRDYEQALRKHASGDGPKPRKPQVDFMERLNQTVKQDVREQARRAGTAAETQTFQATGHTLLSWVTVNASEACPDCRRRQGKTGDAAFWDKVGRPGSGTTICGAACFCMLVPAAAMATNPDLKNDGLNTNPPPVATPPATAKVIVKQDDNDDVVSVQQAVKGEVGEPIPSPRPADAVAAKFTSWAGSLTPEEKDAVREYQSKGTGYDAINRLLRSGEVASGRSEAVLRETIKHLDSAIAKSTTAEPHTVARVMRGKPELLDAWERSMTKGLPWTEDGYASTTFDEQAAIKEFITPKTRTPVVMEIDVPAGTPAIYPAASTGDMAEQAELLLARGRKLLVQSIKQDGKITRVRAEVLPDE